MNTFAALLLCFQACFLQNAYGQWCGAADIIGPAYGYGLGAPFAYGAYETGYGGLGAAEMIGSAYGYGLGLGAPAFAAPGLAAPFAYGAYEAYGGEGIGDVAVIGELPVAGTTLVAGQVPIQGAVEFGGIVPAAGEVSIAGRCAGGCGCRGPYLY